jgi:hypothetical protein
LARCAVQPSPCAACIICWRNQTWPSFAPVRVLMLVKSDDAWLIETAQDATRLRVS